MLKMFNITYDIKGFNKYLHWLRISGDHIDWRVDKYHDGEDYYFKINENFFITIWYFSENNYHVRYTINGIFNAIRQIPTKEKAFLIAKNVYRNWKYKELTGQELIPLTPLMDALNAFLH